MYYKAVNRGLSFTKPGVYAFGLVLVIGMIAVTTGINGLYVFLSAGLGGFVVSGLLSEKAMTSCTVRSVAAAMADAMVPFPVRFTIENRSSWFSVFAMQNLFVLETPRLRLIAKPPPSLAGVRIPRVAPGAIVTCEAHCSGMPRGEYTKVIALQLTTFPFGILEKYKQVVIPASLLVAPQIDPGLLAELRTMVQRQVAKIEAEKEFYCHRSFLPLDPLRDVDWRKSAARAPGDWVVKQYRRPANAGTVRVDAPWGYGANLPDEARYEQWLSRVRTALKALDEGGLPYLLDFGGGMVFEGEGDCRRVLAAAPRFDDRAQGLATVSSVRMGSGASGKRLAIRLESCAWDQAS